jgi:hypothetical protein
MSYIKNRLREPSSWAGLAALLATGAQAWATRDPQAIAATVAGLVAVLTPDKAGQVQP